MSEGFYLKKMTKSRGKNLPKVCWGDVCIRLRNRQNVDEDFLKDIFSHVHLALDERVLLLILDVKDGFGCKNGYRGKTLPATEFTRSDLKRGYDPITEAMYFPEVDNWRADIDRQDLMECAQWDCVVYLPRKTTERWQIYKPYFY